MVSHKTQAAAGWRRNVVGIRRIFKTAFEAARLPYFNPHSFRSTLALLGQRICRTPEDFKVWSQNLGHEQVLTTLTSYGAVSAHRHAEIMGELWTHQNARPEPTLWPGVRVPPKAP
ncbi:MAG: hypothetical protein KJ944_16985 [Alphaproteobacteria bacterium]|nr:hypothetical protein [Alphaproteobacteria bacterium]MBU1563095.1 hypothetical protein [Alphaproteobacteria bacterium]MBU2304289.1 hypothetical protein [Alphaproteobacteria bacterium]MBU2368291.1 hypothetical protein [Alphaproteobacteria bacterium]